MDCIPKELLIFIYSFVIFMFWPTLFFMADRDIDRYVDEVKVRLSIFVVAVCIGLTIYLAY